MQGKDRCVSCIQVCNKDGSQHVGTLCQHAAEVSTRTQKVAFSGISKQRTEGGNVGDRQATDWHTGGCNECVTSFAQCMQAQCCWIRAQQERAQERSAKLKPHKRHTEGVWVQYRRGQHARTWISWFEDPAAEHSSQSCWAHRPSYILLHTSRSIGNQDASQTRVDALRRVGNAGRSCHRKQP